MLVLTRKTNESIVINENVIISINKIEGDSVKIGINAPREIRIYRQEVFEAIKNSNLAAVLTTEKPLRIPQRMLLNLETRIANTTELIKAKELDAETTKKTKKVIRKKKQRLL